MSTNSTAWWPHKEGRQIYSVTYIFIQLYFANRMFVLATLQRWIYYYLYFISSWGCPNGRISPSVCLYGPGPGRRFLVVVVVVVGVVSEVITCVIILGFELAKCYCVPFFFRIVPEITALDITLGLESATASALPWFFSVVLKVTALAITLGLESAKCYYIPFIC